MNIKEIIRDANQANEIIQLGRNSKTREAYAKALTENYEFSPDQVSVILETRLSGFEKEFGPLPSVIDYRNKIANLTVEETCAMLEEIARSK